MRLIECNVGAGFQVQRIGTILEVNVLTLLKSIDKEEYIIEIGEDSYLRLQETLFQNKALWANQWIGFNKIINKPSLVLSSSFTSNIGIGTGSNKFSQLSIIKEK